MNYPTTKMGVSEKVFIMGFFLHSQRKVLMGHKIIKLLIKWYGHKFREQSLKKSTHIYTYVTQ